jgi:MoaA/NifB/PqqE/SkfB family radical SAM enzyme
MERKSKYHMFKFSELETVHLEITNNCQASCPMCARNYHGGQDNPLIKLTGWTLDEFKTIFTQEVMQQLKGVYFCGNFGDPILNNDLIPMVKHLAEHAPELVVNIHTNGGARKTEWWEELARAMPKYHNVCFGIDGLEDTHHIYRIGTTYDNIIKNAKAFIAAGGRAEWAFIKFKHNEHQEQHARDRAASLGFHQFTLKNSSRFLGEPRYRVIDKEGNVTHYIEPPSDNKMHFISKEMIERYKETVMPLEVSCKVQKSKEIYIDAYKNIMPCCWIGSIPYTQYDYDNVNAHIRSEIKRQYNELSQDMGNTNAYEVGIKGVIDSDSWQNKWKTYWTTKKMIMCARICGQNSTFSNPDDQFLERAKIN